MVIGDGSGVRPESALVDPFLVHIDCSPASTTLCAQLIDGVQPGLDRLPLPQGVRDPAAQLPPTKGGTRVVQQPDQAALDAAFCAVAQNLQLPGIWRRM